MTRSSQGVKWKWTEDHSLNTSTKEHRHIEDFSFMNQSLYKWIQRSLIGKEPPLFRLQQHRAHHTLMRFNCHLDNDSKETDITCAQTWQLQIMNTVIGRPNPSVPTEGATATTEAHVPWTWGLQQSQIAWMWNKGLEPQTMNWWWLCLIELNNWFSLTVDLYILLGKSCRQDSSQLPTHEYEFLSLPNSFHSLGRW